MTILNMTLPNTEGGGGGWQPGANTLLYINVDDNDGSTIYDKSGNSNNLTFTSNSYTTDANVGRVLNFTGSIYAQRNSINWGTEYTFHCLANSSSSGNNRVFFTQDATSSHRPNVGFWKVDNYLYGLSNNSNDNGVCSSGDVTVNTWTLWTYTRDNSGTLKLYKNGELDGTYNNSTTPSGYGVGSFYLSRRRNGDNKYFNGKMKIFIGEDRTRIAQEVEDYYNQIKANYGIQSLNNTLTITPNITPNITPDTPNNGSGSVLTI